MLLKSSPPKTPLIPEGPVLATLNSVKGVPDEQNPKRVMLGFKPDHQDVEVFKELPPSLDEGTPLRKDIETLRGKELTPSEALTGFDPAKLIGKRCKIVVMHRSGAGGKPIAVVSLIQALKAAD